MIFSVVLNSQIDFAFDGGTSKHLGYTDNKGFLDKETEKELEKVSHESLSAESTDKTSHHQNLFHCR